MKKLLITGATGNVGMEVIKALQKIEHNLDVFAGVRNLESDSKKLMSYHLIPDKFDFIDVSTFEPALKNCHILFLLRPPQISDTEKYFKPLIEIAKKCQVNHIIFLSVQGVEKSSIIPHHKIEKMIVESQIPYTFLRPAYFMQNFTTTLHDDLVDKKRIFLPAGKAKFTLIDVRDIGEVAAKIIVDATKHINNSYELTCNEKLTFQEMATQLSVGLGVEIDYISPNLVRFTIQKLKENVPFGYILVLIMLHYLPRFQQEPPITYAVKNILGKEPKTFGQFIKDNKQSLTVLKNTPHQLTSRQR
jgi:uncharacterized protein YbjT (DUF2867 family)